ncbi:MAG: hypothetical protein CMJ34_08850 [Phycisphaerae bacterium]|nr:hypothetical protein [Phycisphaerae bacterium]
MTLFATVVDAWWSDTQSTATSAVVLIALGLMAGTLYATLGCLGWRGIGRPFVIRGSILMSVVSVLGLILGLIALTTDQPWHVWSPLLITGSGGLLVFGPMPLFAIVVHRFAERRQLESGLLREDWSNDHGERAGRSHRETT